MEPTDPRTRLLDLSVERGISLAALSALLGRNSSYLQQFVRKGSPRKLEEGDRGTLARFFGVDDSELGGVEEKSFGLPEGMAGKLAGKGQGKPPRADWVDVPRLDLDASAGPGAVALGEQAIGAFRFSAAWLRGQGLDPRQLTAIAVAGDSMEPTLRDGDEILVDRAPRALRDGIHVVRVGDSLLVKRIDLGRPGRIGLISDNAAYRPIEIAPEDVAVIGRVVWKSGRI